MSDTPLSSFQRQIETFFGGGRCFLLAKGRVGLYAGLRALGLPAGSKVLMPGYTCVVVPSAVQFAGFRPMYIDIDPSTYNINPALLERPEYADCRALVIQHTYGIPCDVPRIRSWAESRGIVVMEDCCHAFGSRIEEKLCGTFGKFAFMSGQWNKPFSTGLGGMLLVNDEDLADKVDAILKKESRRPSFTENVFLRMQLAAFDLLVGPRSVSAITVLYRLLSRWGLMIGSSTREEYLGTMPPSYLVTMAPSQARRGMKEMARIGLNIEHRTAITKFYQERLPATNFAAVADTKAQGMPLLRYPVRVGNKRELLDRALRHGVEIGSWFECPLHAADMPLEKLDYHTGQCPEAEAASREVVNLPTHRRIDQRGAERILQFLKRYGKLASKP